MGGVDGARLGIGNIDNVVPVDKNPAGPAELGPLREEVAFLVENQDPVVAAVSHEQPAPGIHRERVRLVHPAVSSTLGPEGFEQASVPAELENPRVGCRGRGMPLGDEDAAIRGHQHVVRLVEKLGFPGAADPAEGEEERAVRTELEDLVALAGGVSLLGGPGAGAVGDPHVPIAVDEDAVGGKDQPGTEALHQRSGRIELEDRIEVRSGATVGTAALGDPDAPAILVDLDRAGRTPWSPRGKPGPAFDGPVRIGRIVDRAADGLRLRRRKMSDRSQHRPEQAPHCRTPRVGRVLSIPCPGPNYSVFRRPLAESARVTLR